MCCRVQRLHLLAEKVPGAFGRQRLLGCLVGERADRQDSAGPPPPSTIPNIQSSHIPEALQPQSLPNVSCSSLLTLVPGICLSHPDPAPVPCPPVGFCAPRPCPFLPNTSSHSETFVQALCPQDKVHTPLTVPLCDPQASGSFGAKSFCSGVSQPCCPLASSSRKSSKGKLAGLRLGTHLNACRRQTASVRNSGRPGTVPCSTTSGSLL